MLRFITHATPRRAAWTIAVVAVAGGCGPTGEDPDPEGPGVLAGQVLDLGGEPLKGVRVTTDPAGREATTNGVGFWRMERMRPETYRVVFAGDGLAFGEVDDVIVEPSEESWVEVNLASDPYGDGALHVQVWGPDGLPLEGARVRATPGPEVTADLDGWALLEGLSGEQIDLKIRDDASLTWGRDFEELHVPEHGTRFLDVTLSGRPLEDSVVVGSATCAGCHPDAAARHGASAHGRSLSPTVEGAFLTWFQEGAQVALGDGKVKLAFEDAQPVVTVTDEAGEDRTFEVDGVIGSERRGRVPWVELGDQAYPLPVAWIAGAPGEEAWPDEAERLVGFEGDRWLDEEGAFAFSDGDRPPPSRSADAACFACHATGFEVSPRADGGADLQSIGGGGERWLEGGVGCERCHGAGSSHVQASAEDRAFRITRPDRLEAKRANETCGQCHAASLAHDSDLPFPYRKEEGLFQPGEHLEDFSHPVADLWASGAAAGPGTQLDELLLSAHGPDGVYTLRCHDCHDPHGSSSAPAEGHPAALRLDANGHDLCLSCHLEQTFGGEPGVIEAHDGHATHDPDGPLRTGRCTSCHMPQTAQRLAAGVHGGTGDLSSHLFEPLPPAQTLEAFHAKGASVLPPGAFPTHACAECHAYQDWLWGEVGTSFWGPTGDPTLIETHEAFHAAFEGMFP